MGDANKKKIILKYRLLFCATTNHFYIGLWCVMKSGFYSTTSSVAGLRRSTKTLPKAKLAPEKSWSLFGGCYPSDPLQLSESWWNHYIWEVCSENQWDTPKLQCLQPVLVNRKGPIAQFFSTTIPNHALHNQHFKCWTIWAKKFCLIHHIHLTSCPQTTTVSSISTTFCRGNASSVSKRQKLLSKNSRNPEARIFMLQK